MSKRLTNLERLNLIIDFIKTNNQPEGYTIREIKDKEGNEKYIVRKNKEEFAWTTEIGNLYMTVFRYDGDENYYVVVSNNYYGTYIPFESADYED